MSAVQPLYMIAAEKVTLLDELVDGGGVLTPELEERLATLEGDFARKLAACAVMVRNLDAECDKYGDERKRLQTREAVTGRAADNLKAYMQRCMETADVERVDGVAALKNNPPSVIYEGDPAHLPEAFKRVSVEINKTALRDAAKAGQVLPEGVRFASAGRSLKLL